MRKSSLNLLVILTMGATLIGCNNGNSNGTSEHTPKDLNVSIIHINDTHSHIAGETKSLYFGGNKTYTSVGGYPRVVSKIRSLQDEKPNTLTLNAGDTFQGTLYYSLFKGEADIAMLNLIEWDALALGNHEFDDGDAHLASYLGKLTTLNSSNILAANIDAPKGNPLEGKWSPYTIKTYDNGAKVGIIGIDIVGKTKMSSNPSDEIIFNDEVTTAQKYIDELQDKGINKIVLLSHVGLDNDKDFASKLSGVDVIVGGDSHSLMGDFSSVGLTSHDTNYPSVTTDKDGNRVCIAQAWQYNYIVGNLNVSFSKDGVVTSCEGTPTLLLGDSFQQKDENGDKQDVAGDAKTAIDTIISENENLEIISEDSDTLTKLATYIDQVDTMKSEKIGTSAVRLGHNRIPNDNYDTAGALPLGSDIAPIVAKSFYDLSNRADACIQNAGGVRVAIESGEVTFGDAYTLLPFANTLFEIEMYGSEVKAVLEDAVDEALYGGTDGSISTGAFPYAYGLKYDVDGNATKGNRVLNLEVKNRESGDWSFINENTMYVIVTNNYIAGGKDEYHTFKTVQDERGEGVDTYLDYAMSFVKYLEKIEESGKEMTKLPATDHPIKSYNSKLIKLGAYSTDKEGGSEIVAYDQASKRFFTTNGEDNSLDIIDISDVKSPAKVKSVDLSTYGKGVNSVAVYDGVVAVAVENGNDTVGKKQLKGSVVIFDTDGTHQRTVEAGFLPDMVTFSEDGSKIIVANEGEPNDNYDVDPIGSVGIITVDSGDYVDIGFAGVTLTDANDGTKVRLGATPSNNQAQDLEPEFVTVSAGYAYVTLQENNAMAKINLANNSVEYVKSYGAKSWEAASGNTIDIEEEGEIKMKSYPGLFGLYQPDSIASYIVDGNSYLVTANEGDGREYEGDTNTFVDEDKIKNLDLADSIKDAYSDENDLKVMIDLGKNGDKYERLYTYGARSFSIWDENGDLVYDSGDEISKKVAEYEPLMFNHDDGEMDGRSGNKGAEPEALTVGKVGEKTYAFVGLERQNAIMIYDISTPNAATFVNYIMTGKDGDISPEGMKFIPADESPNGKNLLLVAFEVSGSTVIYEVK